MNENKKAPEREQESTETYLQLIANFISNCHSGECDVKQTTFVVTKGVSAINTLLSANWMLVNLEPILDGSGRFVYELRKRTV